MLSSKQNFDLKEGKAISGIFSRIWNRCFGGGVVIPSKVRICEDCHKLKAKHVELVKKRFYQHREYKAYLIELKTKLPIEKGHM